MDLSARSISCYLSGSNEPNTRPFLDWAAAEGIRVLFPVTRDDGLLDWTVGEDEKEIQGIAGVPEVAGELLGPIAINDVDLIIVPAAAVDGRGTRLGWGRGYYDKTLGSTEKCPPVYAVVYDQEVLTEVPREVHDQPVDGIVTPTRIISF
jgi:5-formyltetrahydrofolate cyclo-ligase